MLFLDRVYLIDREPPVFRRLPAPRPQALEALIQTISQRVGAYLEREGLLIRDIENTYLQLEASEKMLAHSNRTDGLNDGRATHNMCTHE